jgi:hypothetical protein
MTIKTWNIEEMTGYKPIATFYEDFSIADLFGVDAIRDTYKRAMESWKDDYEYLTELVMVLNWKIWEHYEKNDEYAELYNELWGKADEYATQKLTGDALRYFYETTD